MKPPREIDNAQVLCWAWSGETPFGVVRYENGPVAAEIYGLVICRYAGGDDVYRFSCDAKWESQQDYCYGSIQEAKEELPAQYRQVSAQWIEME